MANTLALPNLNLYNHLVRDGEKDARGITQDFLSGICVAVSKGNLSHQLLNDGGSATGLTADFVCGELRKPASQSEPNAGDTLVKPAAKVKYDPSIGTSKLVIVDDGLFGGHIDVQFTISYKAHADAKELDKSILTLRVFKSNIDVEGSESENIGDWSKDESGTKATPSDEHTEQEPNPASGEGVADHKSDDEAATDATLPDGTRVDPKFHVYSRKITTDEDVQAVAQLTGLEPTALNAHRNEPDSELTHFVIVHQLYTGSDNKYPRGLGLFTDAIFDDVWTDRVLALRAALSEPCCTIHIISTSKEAENILARMLSELKGGDDVSSWWTEHGMSLQENQNQLPKEQWPSCVLPKAIDYHSPRHFLTTTWYSALSEKMHAQNAPLKEATMVKARFVELAGTEGNGFNMLLEEQESLRLQPGDTMKVLFKDYEEMSSPDTNWTGTVIPTQDYAALGETAVFVKRGKEKLDVPNHTGQAQKLEYAYSVLEIPPKHLVTVEQQKDHATVQELLKAMESMEMFIIVVPDTKHITRVLASLNRLWLSYNRGEGPEFLVATNTVQELLASNPAKYVKYDLYGDMVTKLGKEKVDSHIQAAIKPTDARPPPNTEQAKGFEVARSLPGGFLVVSGTAGTGKSFSAMKYTEPFHSITADYCKDSKTKPAPLQGLWVSGINENVDSLARKMEKNLKSVFHAFGDGTRQPIVVRMYTRTSEKQMYSRDASKKRTDQPPDFFDPGAAVDTPDYATEISSFIQETTKTPTPGVANRNFRLPDHSLAQWIVRRSGWESSACGVTKHPFAHPDPKQFASFRNCLDELQNNAVMTPDMKTKLTEEATKVAMSVMSNADAVVTTANLALDVYLASNFKPAYCVVDEAARLTDPEFLSLVFLYRENNDFRVPFILTGDSMQLGPVIMAKDPSNAEAYPFSEMAEVSPFDRLKLGGYAVVQLSQTERHNTFINMVLSATSPSVKNTVAQGNDLRPMKNKLVKLFRKVYPGLWINTDGIHQLNATKSKLNPNNVSAVLEYILKWTTCKPADIRIKPSDILIITTYKAQKNLYQNSMQRLCRQLRQLHQGDDADRAQYGFAADVDLAALATELEHDLLPKVNTADCVQGDERPVLIYDLTTSSTLGYLSKTARSYTPMSRAKDGMVIVGNLEGIEAAGQQGKKAKETSISRLCVHFRKLRLVENYKPNPDSLVRKNVEAVVDTARPLQINDGQDVAAGDSSGGNGGTADWANPQDDAPGNNWDPNPNASSGSALSSADEDEREAADNESSKGSSYETDQRTDGIPSDNDDESVSSGKFCNCGEDCKCGGCDPCGEDCKCGEDCLCREDDEYDEHDEEGGSSGGHHDDSKGGMVSGSDDIDMNEGDDDDLDDHNDSDKWD